MAMIKVSSYLKTIKGRRVRVKGYNRGQSWSQRSKRSKILDRAHKAEYRPAKRFKRGISHRGDWTGKYRK